MFIKIRSQTKIPDWTLLKGEFVGSYGPVNCYQIGNVEYYNNFFDNINFKILPVSTYYVEIIDNCFPHTDPYPGKATLNFVIESGNAKTTFFEKKLSQVYGVNNIMNNNTLKNPNMATVFKEEDLVEYNYFHSHPGDFYLIDTSKIHSVKIDKPHLRRLISWRWDYIPIELIEKKITLIS